jgi:hypothetical protein
METPRRSPGSQGCNNGRHGAEMQQCYQPADEIYNGMRPSTTSTAPMICAIDGGQLHPLATLVQLQRTDGVK